MSFEKMTPQQRVTAVNIDCMRSDRFALLAGTICMGVSDAVEYLPTACTDGVDKFYGIALIKACNRKQLRYVVLHENFHVAFKHLLLFTPILRKHKTLANIAMDYVVNGNIEDMDPEFKFVERPTFAVPLVDAKYSGWSFPQVFNDLLQQAKQMGYDPEKGEGGGDGEEALNGLGTPLDEHRTGRFSEDAQGKAEQAQVSRQIDDANRQGEQILRRMRGGGAGGRDIFELGAERVTDWREPLREFISSIGQGDDQSRFCPPNKRLLASGFIMPSHFTETVGEIILACDTSGSMAPYYPVVFGEIAKICQDVKPERVRMLWWDTSVCGDQVFEPKDYENIAKQLKPKGGGGTTVSCVAQYIKDKKIDAKAVVYLTDGMLESVYELPEKPILWGVVDNDRFVPRAGKILRIVV